MMGHKDAIDYNANIAFQFIGMHNDGSGYPTKANLVSHAEMKWNDTVTGMRFNIQTIDLFFFLHLFVIRSFVRYPNAFWFL